MCSARVVQSSSLFCIYLVGANTPIAVCCNAVATERHTDHVLIRKRPLQVLENIGRVRHTGYPVGENYLVRGRCLNKGEFAFHLGQGCELDPGVQWPQARRLSSNTHWHLWQSAYDRPQPTLS